MKKEIFLLLALCYVNSLFADGIKIDDLYYNLYSNNGTAEVTYKDYYHYSNIYIGIDREEYNKGWTIKKAVIPESITFKGMTYIVRSIGENAFRECKFLNAIVIPKTITYIHPSAFIGCNDLPVIDNIRYADTYLIEAVDKTLLQYNIKNGTRWIGNFAFQNCNNITTIIIPNTIISIGTQAFEGCSSLTNIVIPNGVKSVGRNAFSNCPQLIIYSSGNTGIPDFPGEQHKWVSSENILYYYPFSIFAKVYVENGVNEWQKKDEFERVADWQKRVNEQTRQEKTKELLVEAEQKYIAFHSKEIRLNPTLGKYDAENEVFALNDDKYGLLYMAVPLDEARDFKKNWENKNLSSQLQIKDDQVLLASISIKMPNGKEYTYRNTDAVNYNLSEVEYNFDPLEIDIPQSSSIENTQGKKNITSTKIKAGKSQVDTNIPETNAANSTTFVIIFANEDYKNVASVPFAKNDGSIFQKYCQKTLGIPTSNIHYVENATYNDIRIQLAWLKNVCDKYEGEASVILYYAGHGIPDVSDKSAYLLPVDGDGRYVSTAYKLDELYQKLGKMPAKSITVLLDACFSGANRDGKMLASERGVALAPRKGVPTGNMVVLSAAQGDETALPNEEEGHGMFTYYVLKKLQETKGDVTLQELSQYVIREVGRKTAVVNKPQTPCVTPSASVGDTWQSWKLR